MLTSAHSRAAVVDVHRMPGRQSGVVLFIALVMLIVMTLGALALVRSVDTTNVIAGNLAFQQAATRSAESGTEDAIRSVLDGVAFTALNATDYSRGYAAFVTNPTTSWDVHWRTTVNPNPVSTPVVAKTCVDRVCTLPTDAAGNTVSYTIERLCATAGDPKLEATGCASGSRKLPLEGEDTGPDKKGFTQLRQYYYRITTKVVGPRNTTSYIQTIVAK